MQTKGSTVMGAYIHIYLKYTYIYTYVMHDLCVWITRIAYLQECICRSIIPKKYIPPWKSKTKPKNDLWDDPCKGFQILPWGRVWSAWTSSVLDLKFNSIRTSNSRVSICWFFLMPGPPICGTTNFDMQALGRAVTAPIPPGVACSPPRKAQQSNGLSL